MTADPARIRRVMRQNEFATAQDATVLAGRPDAKPSGSDSFVVPSFFVSTTVAQAMTTEKFALRRSARMREAAETTMPLNIGTDIAIAPVLPQVRMRDRVRGLDRAMLLAGVSIDLQIDHNSIEGIG